MKSEKAKYLPADIHSLACVRARARSSSSILYSLFLAFFANVCYFCFILLLFAF